MPADRHSLGDRHPRVLLADALAGVLDPAVVDQLRMLARAGSTELLDKLETSFARDTPERLAALRTALAEGDRDAIAFNLHTLKGSAANLGALAVVAACKAIEDSAERPGSARLAALLRRLEQAAADAQAALAALAASG
jgi:HPt (histidine-containing phosphotransfer) domain-containing protein